MIKIAIVFLCIVCIYLIIKKRKFEKWADKEIKKSEERFENLRTGNEKLIKENRSQKKNLFISMRDRD